MRLLKSVTLLGIGVCAFAFSITVEAQVQQSFYMHQPWLSARVLGMGGAFTAVADDYQALYYNPAGLARLPGGQFVADFYVEGTPAIIGFENSLGSANGNASSIQNALSQNFGSHFASRVGLGGTWVKPGWGIGIQPVDLTAEIDINSTAGATLGLVAYQDTLVQFGKAWTIGGEEKAFHCPPPSAAQVAPAAPGTLPSECVNTEAGGASNFTGDEPGRLTVGIAPKAVYRAYINLDENVFSLIQNGNNFFIPQDAAEGLTFDTDIGAMYSLPIPVDGWWKWMKYAKPTFAIAIRNLVDYGFPSNLHLYNANSSSNPISLGRRFDFGSDFQLPDFKVFHPHFMIDFRDVGAAQADFIKCMHIGAELKWRAFSWLNGGYRMGLSEGYLTFGLSAELADFMIDLAAYSEDIGTTGTPIASQRYIAQLSLDF